MCDLTKFKSCIRPQPRWRARSKTKPQEAGNILAPTTGHLLSRASSRGWGSGGEVGNPGRQPTKWLLANGIKKYQNISKNFKNCQAWQTHSAGSPRTCGAALCSTSLSWRPGHRPLPSEDAQNLQRQRGCGQAMAGTASPGQWPAVWDSSERLQELKGLWGTAWAGASQATCHGGPG